MIYVANWQDHCWQNQLGHCASDTMLGFFHVSFGCCWACIEVLVNEFFAQVRAPIREAASHCLEEGRYFWVAQ